MTLVIGDSIFSGGSSVVRHLSEWAGHPFVNKAVVGAGFRRGWVESIPEQYEKARHVEDSILMDGGGNDVFSMLDKCTIFSPECQGMIDDINQTFRRLLDHMGVDGVEHVVFLGPYYIRESLRRATDYGVDRLHATCQTTTTPCHFVDIRNLTFPRAWDGIHPTEEGYVQIATAIWNTKLDQDIPM